MKTTTGEIRESNRMSKHLEDNRKKMEETFAGCGDIEFHPSSFGDNFEYKAVSVFCSTLIKDKTPTFMHDTLNDLFRKNVEEDLSPERVRQFFIKHGASTSISTMLTRYDQAVDCILNGYVVIWFDHWDTAIGYEAFQVAKREVGEPIGEPSVQGPREGTTERLADNIGMIRERLKTPRLKVEYLVAGSVSKTKIAYMYVDQAVKPATLEQFRSRLNGIDPYEVLETSYIEDWIEDSTYSPFPQYMYTERTDFAAASLLDGKIIVLVSNTPMILVCPALFVEFFATSEDYYTRTIFASLIRLLRVWAFIVALLLPSIYIALSTFHPELIPTVLLLAILDTREGIPFPAFFEALVMEIFFELLREAGIRLPRPVGSAVSIVGALVIGQAAIQAKIASPMMVIVVALTGIASFAIPHYNMGIALRVLRFPLMMVSSLLGGFGLMIGFLLTLVHLTSLNTLGEPYMSSLAPLKLRNMRDVFIRAPLSYFLKSPRNRHLHDPRRSNS